MDCLVPIEENGRYVYKKLEDIITPFSWHYISDFELFEKGFLPNGRGWNQESNKFIQAMKLINSEFKKCERKASKD